ncbi:MAG: hypothetical protein WAU28_01130 [Candidatus Moraniibacteriota bacterium]
MSEKLLQQSVAERDKRADVMVRFLDAAKNIEVFQGKKLEEVFGNEQSKRDFLADLSREDFVTLINGMNGILRGRKKEDWGMDGDAVALVPGAQNPDNVVIPPRAEDKLGLFGELHAGMKTMIEGNRDISDIALLLASGINEVHSYEDANGRTSRLVYTLLTENFDNDGKERIKQILGEYGSFHIDINPGLIGWEIDDVIHKEIGLSDSARNPENITNSFDELLGNEMTFREGITDDIKKRFTDIFRDKRNGFYAAFQLISGLPNRNAFLRAYTGRSVILEGRLASELDKDQMSELIEGYWALKKRKAEILIDCIVHPDNLEYQIETGGESMSLLEYFKLRIKKEQEKNKELL